MADFEVGSTLTSQQEWLKVVGGVVVSVVVAHQTVAAQRGFVGPITSLTPKPGIGWTTSDGGATFSPPPPPPLPATAAVVTTTLAAGTGRHNETGSTVVVEGYITVYATNTTGATSFKLYVASSPATLVSTPPLQQYALTGSAGITKSLTVPFHAVVLAGNYAKLVLVNAVLVSAKATPI